MSVAKVIEVISQSPKSFEDAVHQGIARASESISGITSAWVKDQNVLVANGRVTGYSVALKLTFVLESSSDDGDSSKSKKGKKSK